MLLAWAPAARTCSIPSDASQGPQHGNSRFKRGPSSAAAALPRQPVLLELCGNLQELEKSQRNTKSVGRNIALCGAGRIEK